MRTTGFKIKRDAFVRLLNRVAPTGIQYTVSDAQRLAPKYEVITVTPWEFQDAKWEKGKSWDVEVNNFLMLQPKPKEIRK